HMSFKLSIDKNNSFLSSNHEDSISFSNNSYKFNDYHHDIIINYNNNYNNNNNNNNNNNDIFISSNYDDKILSSLIGENYYFSNYLRFNSIFFFIFIFILLPFMFILTTLFPNSWYTFNMPNLFNYMNK